MRDSLIREMRGVEGHKSWLRCPPRPLLIQGQCSCQLGRHLLIVIAEGIAKAIGPVDMSDSIVVINGPANSGNSNGNGVSTSSPRGAVTGTASRCTLYLNVTLLCAIAALLLSGERDIFSIFTSAAGGLLSRNSLLDDDLMNLQEAYHLLPDDESPPLPGRFPRLGSLEFKKHCSWTAMPTIAHKNCTVYMTPRPESHEGISYWLSETIMSYMEARMGHCQFYLDYGKGVNVHDVLIPASDFVPNPQDILSPLLGNWRVPDNFVCREEDKCITDRFPDTSVPPSSKYDKPPPMFQHQGTMIGPIPRYRFAFQYPTSRLYRDDYKQTAALLPGWGLEIGAACSLGNLFHVAPSAANYDNDGRLFSEILPMVRQNPTFAIYIRTGRAEHYNMTSQEYEDKLANTRAESVAASATTALELERRYLNGELGLGYKGMPANPLPINEIEHIVWLVITDDPEVRTQFLEEYDKEMVGLRKGGTSRKLPAKITGKITKSGGQTIRVSYDRKPEDQPPPTKSPQAPKIKTHVGGTTVDKPEKTEGKKMEEAKIAGITRRIVVTSARGAHTRLEGGGVSTADFAEAFIDWYLLGESDAVIANKLYSFGMTAAFRTARPIYDPNEYQQSGELKPLKMVWEGSPALGGDNQKNFLRVMDSFCLKHPGFKGEVGMLGRKYDMDCKGGKQRRRKLREGELSFHRFSILPMPGRSNCDVLCIISERE